MTRQPYTADIVDDRTGTLVLQVDCEVECFLDDIAASPQLCVSEVYINEVNILKCLTPLQMLGAHIAELAEADAGLRETVMEAEGVRYVGKGGNDPDGNFERSLA